MHERSFPFARSVPKLPGVHCPPRPDIQRTATLRLRASDGQLTAKVAWPKSSGLGDRPPLLVYLSTSEHGNEPSEPWLALCGTVGVVGVAPSWRSHGASAFDDAVTATEWAADHASELEADRRRLVIAGEGTGAGIAAELAVHMRDNGWPSVALQVLLYPRLGALKDAQRSLHCVAPAVIVTGRDDGRAFAERLRQVGVPVDEFPHDPSNPNERAPAEVAQAIGRALATR